MDEQENLIEELRSQLQEKDTLFTQINELKNREFDGKDNLILELNTELEKKGVEIERLAMELEENETLLNTMNEKVLMSRKIGDDSKAMKSDLEKNNKLINDLWAQLEEKDIAIKELELQISKLDEEVRCNKEDLLKLESDIMDKNEIIKDLERRLNAKQLQKRTIDLIPVKESSLHEKIGLDSAIGGWPSSYKPNRLNPKLNKMIKPGVVKVTSTKVRKATSKLKNATKMIMLSKLKAKQ